MTASFRADVGPLITFTWARKGDCRDEKHEHAGHTHPVGVKREALKARDERGKAKREEGGSPRK